MNKVEIAQQYFATQFNCSQSVFTAFAPDFGITVDNSLKIACAFGGGMGKQQHTCGAVTGALMAIGLKYGKGFSDADEKKQLTYEKTIRFFDEFKAIHGSINCKDLLKGLNMNKPDDLEQMLSEAMFTKLCPQYVATAVQITEQLFAEHNNEQQ
jgi:C_GCAxxG_C_C family probable redox protein